MNSEKSFKGNRTQADLLRLPGNFLTKGEYVQINNVNISQDTTMPDYRTGKYKVQMISVDVNGKDGIVTLSDGNEVITPKISDLINAKYDAELAALGTTDAIADIESKIKIEPIHQEILNLLPDYSNVKISLENDRGGLGYVGDFKQREEDNSKNTRISTTIKYSGVPSSEIYTHELLHYFTIPALILYQQGNRSENIKQYVEALDKLYTKAKSKGYTSINGVSVHDNLNEFAVNITNEKSIEQLKKLGIYDDLINLTKNYLNSLQTSTSVSNAKADIERRRRVDVLNAIPVDDEFVIYPEQFDQFNREGDEAPKGKSQAQSELWL